MSNQLLNKFKSNNSNQNYIITDTIISASELNTLDGNYIGTVNASSVNTITGSAADINTAYFAGSTGTITGLGNEAVTLDDSTIAASSLNTLDAYTTGVVNAASITTITGTFTEIYSVYSSNIAATISGLGNEDITLAGTITVAQFNTIAASTSGIITATISAGDMSSLNAITETGNALTITVTDASVAAGDLNTLEGKTTVAVVVASTTITGAYSDVNDAFDANTAGTISGLGNEAITISETITVTQFNDLAAKTTGVITATISDHNMSSLSGITESGHALTISVTDTVVVAADLNALNARTLVTLEIVFSKTIAGSAAEINTIYVAYAAGQISGLGDEELIITDLTISASSLNTLNANTTGTLKALAVTSITGSAADINTIYAAYAAGQISGLGDEAVTITDTTVDATLLITLDAFTSGLINASSINNLTGSDADQATIRASSGITGLPSSMAGADIISSLNISAEAENVQVDLEGFNTRNYLEKYSDLKNTFGNNTALAVEHYIQYGHEEGRTDLASGSGGSGSGGSGSGGSSDLTDLEAYNYIASNNDLISAFGVDIEAAKSHYTNHGKSEGRSLTLFSATDYLSKYSDLSAVFGDDQTSALKHYIQYGYAEGRTDSSSGSSGSSNLTDFQALNYIASNGDLISAFGNNTEAAKSHYTNHGKSEGRTLDNFDEWGYLASNNDLMNAFGSNTTEAIKHFISYGKSEGRVTNLFNATSYLNNYGDLKNAFGDNEELATKHYVEYGFNEERGF